MNKLEGVLNRCRKFHQTYEKQIKIAVIALVVITALLLFGGKGEKDEIVVVTEGEPQAELNVDKDDEMSDNLSGTIESETAQRSNLKMVVDISGCVKKPGIYEMQDGTRLYEVVQMAGGLTKDADIDAINQAELVTDGQKILIPGKANENHSGNTISGTISQNGKININHADNMTLQQIPGIGPATAEKIIQYRETNGLFKTIEDIKNIEGIGEKTFKKMEDKICV
ncbi:MAG: helix-hairpin-helix domain-containing protein [Firmicutes bacterium]|nr:helix-hairpin-helix domain-containing protein [Bacillota bacterium]